jgi:hypothetical protein
LKPSCGRKTVDRDDIIKMAREAGLLRTGDGWTEPHRWGAAEIERFAALVAAQEREACIKAVEKVGQHGIVTQCAAAIRARG